MAKAYINERKFGSPLQDRHVLPIHGQTVRTQGVTFSGSTQSAAIGAGTDYIDFTADAAAHYAIGDNPTATTSSPRINANERICEQIEPGQKIAFIAAA